MSKRSPWKSNLIKPSRRKQVYSKKEKRWLDPTETEELLRLLEVNRKRIMDGTSAEIEHPIVDGKEEETSKGDGE